MVSRGRSRPGFPGRGVGRAMRATGTRTMISITNASMATELFFMDRHAGMAGTIKYPFVLSTVRPEKVSMT